MIKNIYCDFDGTITKTDTVNDFFGLYADEKWLYYESLWVDGKITSQENAIKQVGLVKPMSEEVLNKYIDSIEIDDYFMEFLDYIKSKNMNLTVVSDGFDLFIEKVFQKYKIKDVPFYANHLVYENEKFSIEFPNHYEKCDIGAGMCKCKKVQQTPFCYIGDGTSDLCIAKKADVLFATKNLKKYCDKNSIEHFSFNSFKDVMNTMKTSC